MLMLFLPEEMISDRSGLPVTPASGKAGGPFIVSSSCASSWALYPGSQSVRPVMQSIPSKSDLYRKVEEHQRHVCCSRSQRSCSPQSHQAGNFHPYAALILNSQFHKQRQRTEQSS